LHVTTSRQPVAQVRGTVEAHDANIFPGSKITHWTINWLLLRAKAATACNAS